MCRRRPVAREKIREVLLPQFVFRDAAEDILQPRPFGYALHHMSQLSDRPEGFEGEFFDLLFNSADIHTFAPEEKIKYQNDMTTDRDIRNQIAYAEQKGFEQGVEQSQESTAKNMLALGLSDDVVVKATGLSGERIAQLKEDNK